MDFFCPAKPLSIKTLPVVVLALSLSLAGCFDRQADKKAPPPPGVLVSKIEYREIEQTVTYVGRTMALNDVSLQAQVSGYLLDTPFEEGAYVTVGQELFIIDPEKYEAAVAAAKGGLAKAKAGLVRARKDLKRYRELKKNNNISEQKVDAALSEVLQMEAEVEYAKAELQRAELDLKHTRITAPIDGRIGRKLVTKGNMISPQGDILARVVEMDPMYVTFNIAESDLITLKKNAMASSDVHLGKLEGSALAAAARRAARINVRLILPDRSEYAHIGKIDFIDNAVDPKTGSILVRARFDNPNEVLVPGLYVRALLSRSDKQNTLLVHASAVQEDQAGRFVLVVLPDNKVEMRRIQTGLQIGGDLVVEEGLEPDEMVVVEGVQKIRPGMTVKPRIAVLPGDEKKLELAPPMENAGESPAPSSETPPDESQQGGQNEAERIDTEQTEPKQAEAEQVSE